MVSIQKKIWTCVLTLVLLVSSMTAGSVSACAVSQEELDQLKEERDALVRQRQNQQAVVDSLRQQQAGVLQIKAALDERNVYALWQIKLNEEEIALYDEMIADKGVEVEEAKATEDAQLELYRSRVRAMEENGNYGLIAMLFNTSDLGDFLTAMDDIGEIMQKDRELEDAYIEAREHTEEIKAEYEEYREDIVEKQDEIKIQQQELENELNEAAKMLNDLTADMYSNYQILVEMEETEKMAETAVANYAIALEKQRQAELAAAQRASAPSGGGGGSVSATGAFTWPVPSCTYITSRFGLRVHPVYGTEKNHTGLDIGAASGATIVAADGGTVTLAGMNGGYGNCVMIDHGNGYQTLYGHLSAISVSSGSTVSKGQTIGYVGSSGVSTGPHCHFEVFAGGGRIDPEQFFSGLSFSEDAGV